MQSVLQDQFGLYAHVSGLTLLEMLEQPIPTHCLTRIAAAQFYIPIERITHTDRKLRIPQENEYGVTTIYIMDLGLWIVFIQSNLDKHKAYAWKLLSNAFQNGIQPMNQELLKAGWKIEVTVAMHHYLSQHWQECQHATQRWLEQHPVTLNHAIDARRYTATQRIPRFAAQWPVQDPVLDKLQDELLNKIRAGMQPFQTKL
jgi:hypothetical protein